MKTIDTKTCSQCNLEKPLTEFYTQKKHSKTRGNWIYYNPECKKCTKNRAYEWKQKEENRESWLSSQKKRNKNFVDQIRAASKRQKEEGYYKNWQQNNKDKTSNYNTNRVMNKTHDITEEEWELCKSFFEYECAYCGVSEIVAVEIYEQKLHREHVDHEGSNFIDNCVPACKGCNSKKFTFLFEEWYVAKNPIYLEERNIKIHEWLGSFK